MKYRIKNQNQKENLELVVKKDLFQKEDDEGLG